MRHFVTSAGMLAAALATSATQAFAQDSASVASQFIPVRDEPAPKLRLDPPLAGPLERGVAVIPYRLENFRVLPIFGAAATGVSPRVGHLHVTVDNLPWHWADAGDTDSVVVADLPAGPHSVLIELATPEHRIIIGQRVHFEVPATEAAHHRGERRGR